ncbi:prolyl-tRNA synthetase associated domain-containing protein 1-like [Halocaridina rubra]|uniref:PrdX deacylase domain-containing protein 1 n=1 Tax=Halocaridina rubra TaxID=373956 RepID=A0AAN8X7U7_HALRR
MQKWYSKCTMATGTTMYHLPKQVATPAVVNLPTSMYKMQPLNKFASADLAPSYYGATCRTLSNQENHVDLVELERRQEAVLLRLETLKLHLDKLQSNKVYTNNVTSTGAVPAIGAAAQSSPVKTGTVHDLVISASPDKPPYSLVLLRKLLREAGFPVYCANHLHSSVKEVSSMQRSLFNDNPEGDRSNHSVAFTIHWKDVPVPCLMVNPLRQTIISGEANIVRYISRLFPLASVYNYEASGTFASITETDILLDMLESQILNGKNKEKQGSLRRLNERLGKQPWLKGGNCSIVDIMAWSAVKQIGLDSGAPANIAKWLKAVSTLAGIDSDMSRETANAARSDISPNSYLDRRGLEKLLESLNIKYQVQDHEEVFTVDALLKNVTTMPGLHMKNLFLKDKKKNLYLLSAQHNVEVKLNDIAKNIGIKDVRFGDEDVMFDILGVKQGCVTAYALANDKNKKIKFLLDAEAFNESHPYINFHPMSNAATLGISPADLKKFLNHTGHEPVLLTF